MVPASNPSSVRESESGEPLSVAALVATARSLPVFFFSVFIFVAVVICTYAALATPRYKVSVQLLIRSGDQGGSALQSLASQFGGLASMAGINVGGSVDEQEALALLKSRRLGELFFDREGLLPLLFPAKWDSNSRGWKSDLLPNEVPTIDGAWVVFDKSVRQVDQNEKNRVVTLQMQWTDRELAAKWANDYVALANEVLRKKVVGEVDASLRFLGEQASQAQLVDLQQSIYKMMAAQINRKVMANSRPDFAYSVIDPAAVPDLARYSSPKRGLLYALSFPLGLFCALCATFAVSFLRTLIRT